MTNGKNSILLKELMIKNFKSIEDLKINCRRVNIFIGPPGSGKSNILEALYLLSLGEVSEVYRVSKIEHLFYMYDISRKIEVSTNNLKINITLENYYLNFEIYYNDKKFTKSGYFSLLSSIREKLPLDCISHKIRFYRFLYDKTTTLKDYNLNYLKPPFGENMISLLKKRKDIMKFLNDHLFFDMNLELKEAVGYDDLFLVPKGEILVLIPLSKSSDGILRYIFNLLAIETNENCIIALEEPEAHIFPFYVRDLAKRIANSNNQFFIATHNPIFVESLLEFVNLDELAIFWTTFKGKTEVKEISGEKLKKLTEKLMETDLFSAIEEIL